MIFFRALAGLFAAILLLVPAAGRYHGSGIRALEMPTALEPQYLGMSVLLFALALLMRRRWLIGLAGLAVLYHAVQVVPWYFGGRPIDPDALPLKVLSFNVLGTNSQYDQVIDWVKAQEPQVAVFQEVVPPWPDELQKLRTTFPYHFRVAELQMDVFSKLPILDPDFQKFGKMRGFIRFTVDLGRPVTIYATHTYPQFHFGMEGFGYHREHLVDGLPADVNTHRGTPVIILGDLNSTMWSPHYAALVQKTGLKNARKGFGVCPSLGQEKNWTPWTAVAFDHCLISGDIGVARFATGPYLGSDHLPIVAELRIPRAGGAKEEKP